MMAFGRVGLLATLFAVLTLGNAPAGPLPGNNAQHARPMAAVATSTNDQKPLSAAAKACNKRILAFFLVDETVINAFRHFSLAVADTEDASSNVLSTTEYNIPLSYVGNEVNLINLLLKYDQTAYDAPRQAIDQSGDTNVAAIIHQIIFDEKKRDRFALDYSDERYEYYLSLSRGIAKESIDQTPQIEAKYYTTLLRNDRALLYRNPHLCDASKGH